MDLQRRCGINVVASTSVQHFSYSLDFQVYMVHCTSIYMLCISTLPLSLMPKHYYRVSFNRFSFSFMLPQVQDRKNAPSLFVAHFSHLWTLSVLYFIFLNIWYCTLLYFYCIRIPVACAHTQATNNEYEWKRNGRQHH